ncbi:hypothetical protein FHQ18_09935 [Deferribacter autotrophicus]|uniref:Type II secretion system protein n=1 Tax=Deferribacter autotrophicus TaxID=500465 RepID=A0A5A8F1Q3_9BACT|nr:pilus assembly PilX N-terminal domain-containing protein [Deferribacter autotrophicus]KAA0257357.1 hypothetical protein FHQ18_09935 [Deferribacter autotrophicus]
MDKNFFVKLNNKGVSLLFAIFLLLVFSFIGVTLITILINETISSSEELLSIQAFYLAESGCEIAITDNLTDRKLSYNSNNTATINYNNFTIEIKRKIYDNVTVFECEAYTGDIKRKIRVKIKNNI